MIKKTLLALALTLPFIATTASAAPSGVKCITDGGSVNVKIIGNDFVNVKGDDFAFTEPMLSTTPADNGDLVVLFGVKAKPAAIILIGLADGTFNGDAVINFNPKNPKNTYIPLTCVIR